jgi:3-oxoacid CoA-transferase subunit B
MDVTADGLLLRETAPGVGIDEIQSKTGTTLLASDSLHEMQLLDP